MMTLLKVRYFNIRRLPCVFSHSGLFFIVLCLVAGIHALQADTWREHKRDVEWAFKLGAVRVALEKCPFKEGPRFKELENNAKTFPLLNDMRTFDEGRSFMMILDGADLRTLCRTAFKFYGPAGKDLSQVLAVDRPSSIP